MKKGKAKVFVIILIILILIVGGAVLYFRYFKTDEAKLNSEQNNSLKEEIEQKKLQIYQGMDRPIAVMIDNEKPAWPHSGLQDAYMVYEVLIEGGESRLMALYKNKTTSKIGPIRSSRHYFVHYALEQNAIYCHFGWSPKAESTIKSNSVNNINGIYDEYYWRVGGGYHNAFTSIEKINEYAKSKGYVNVSSDEPKYNYSIDEKEIENGISITDINLKYSNLHSVSYKYSEQDKVFYRSMRGTLDVDRETKKQYFAKNIVILYMDNYALNDGQNKGRQELDNIGTGKGYYVTNGKYEEITWKKDAIKQKTLWLDSNNKEIVLNDGITYVQIVPTNNKVDFTLKQVEQGVKG